MLRVLDLFSGIGGFSLGLERTGGFETVAFCEIEPFPRRVLAKHWPNVPVYEDVRTLDAVRLVRDGIGRVDVICGGFPCQDISTAGKGAGIEGERSGLWREYARLVGDIRPSFVIIENVPALRTRGADKVLSDLEALDYAGEPVVVGAVHAGAPHKRQRVWIVAYDALGGRGHAHIEVPAAAVAGAARGCGSELALAYTNEPRAGAGWVQRGREFSRSRRDPLTDDQRGRHTWPVEPDVDRMAHGVPSRVDRLRALGNAVVPQIPELIGHAILASLTQHRSVAA